MREQRTIHLRPAAAAAPRALLPGDPGRALALAQELIDSPKMFNHHRGLWGYSGPAKADGQPLLIQSTGIGGPSAAIVLEELILLGLSCAVRVGTCGALHPALQLGDVVLATEALAADGVGRLLSGDRVSASESLSQALSCCAQPTLAGLIVSTDLFYEPAASGRQASWRAAGALAIEMEAAALFALAAKREIAIGCLLIVSDVFGSHGERRRIDDELLLARARSVGAAAVRASGA